jgi:hypothetical protein
MSKLRAIAPRPQTYPATAKYPFAEGRLVR